MWRWCNEKNAVSESNICPLKDDVKLHVMRRQFSALFIFKWMGIVVVCMYANRDRGIPSFFFIPLECWPCAGEKLFRYQIHAFVVVHILYFYVDPYPISPLNSNIPFFCSASRLSIFYASFFVAGWKDTPIIELRNDML